MAVYADPDRDALHVRLADEAYALGGDDPASSYLDPGKLLRVAEEAGADAIHPGYGFLAENADFAQSVIDSGLVWIGPQPRAMRALGDKVAARKVAETVGAPLVAGTAEPVSGAEEVCDFAEEHGLPIAIKAAFGGGGRGLKVARSHEEIAPLYDSAVREATAAFGRGECFVERYLDRPRHVETQCLADEHGTVTVISTRDCSLQRRHQKLVEEAPAPFLTAEQTAELYAASKKILANVGYVGAGTCEFLVGQDGTISFLEVNTRIQVEHPVSEEVTGVDLMREMFRIARGDPLEQLDPAPRGHSIEFRINSEDPGRGFLPVPGLVREINLPAGPGVRTDAGVTSGDVIGPEWDSLIAKLIVTGATREQALRRSYRALSEFEVSGVPTTLPFHLVVVEDLSFSALSEECRFDVHTRWIENDFDNRIEPQIDESGEIRGVSRERETMVVEVDGRRVEVSLPAITPSRSVGETDRKSRRPRRKDANRDVSGEELVSPMQGTVIKVAVEEGQRVEVGDPVVVLEAMKMEQPLVAHRDGVVRELAAVTGASVVGGAKICRLTDTTVN